MASTRPLLNHSIPIYMYSSIRIVNLHTRVKQLSAKESTFRTCWFYRLHSLPEWLCSSSFPYTLSEVVSYNGCPEKFSHKCLLFLHALGSLDFLKFLYIKILFLWCKVLGVLTNVSCIHNYSIIWISFMHLPIQSDLNPLNHWSFYCI